MTRNALYTAASAALLGCAAAAALIALYAPRASGVAVLLLAGSGVAAVLRIRERMRSESRHRWALQRRVETLEKRLGAPGGIPEPKRDFGSTEPGPSGDSEDYVRFALLHDRIHALEVLLERGA